MGTLRYRCANFPLRWNSRYNYKKLDLSMFFVLASTCKHLTFIHWKQTLDVYPLNANTWRLEVGWTRINLDIWRTRNRISLYIWGTRNRINLYIWRNNGYVRFDGFELRFSPCYSFFFSTRNWHQYIIHVCDVDDLLNMHNVSGLEWPWPAAPENNG